MSELTCACHWEGSVFYADKDCVIDGDNPRYFNNLVHDVPRNMPEMKVSPRVFRVRDSETEEWRTVSSS